jgi:hypothetical protein
MKARSKAFLLLAHQVEWPMSSTESVTPPGLSIRFLYDEDVPAGVSTLLAVLTPLAHPIQPGSFPEDDQIKGQDGDALAVAK